MPELSARSRRRRARRRRLAAAGIGITALAVGGGVAIAETSGSDTGPVTAAITTGALAQTVEASGSVAASTDTDVSFATNGTVAKVAVKAGDMVVKGQVLATLDTTSLQSTVDSASVTVASAEQRLENDENGETNTSGLGSSTGSGGSVSAQSASETALTPSSSASSPPGGTKTAPSGGTASLSTLVAQITAAQPGVLAAQKKLDAAQTVVNAAQQTVSAAAQQNKSLRDAEVAACGASTTTPTTPTASETPTASDTPATSETPATSDTPSGSASGTPSADGDCSSAQAAYEAFADTLSTDTGALAEAITSENSAIAALEKAEATLNQLLARLPSAAASASKSTSPSTAVSNGASTSKSLSPSTATTTTTVASASQLAADQAQIDAAAAQLNVAEQNLSAAELKSPQTGMVADVTLAAGSSSAGGSVTILGTGNQVITIDVPLSEIDQVKAGQPAKIEVDGRTGALKGTVTWIGLVSSSSGSVTTFPVTVALVDGSPALHDGVGADVTITTGTSAGAVLVPNSAITTVGTLHTVTVVRNGKASRTRITIGLVGTDYSQVTAGLAAGEEVELADPKQALPSSATSSSSTRTGFGGAFPAGFTGFGGFGRGGR